jgi:magnesium-protoporphyrin IX monomethyl ester (oxidative) cyclase
MKQVITLINPPQLTTRHQVTDGIVPPLGLLYLSSVLKQNRFNVKLIDALGENPREHYRYKEHLYRGINIENILNRIDKDSKLIGISCMFSINHFLVMELCKLIKERFPTKFIILGGSHITAIPKYILKSQYVDFICLGEGETTILKLCQSLSKNNWRKDMRLSKIKGLGFKDKDSIFINHEIELLEDIDDLPYPDWDSIPIDNYFEAKQSHGSLTYNKWIVMLSSRGCPYQCTFCNTPYIWKRKWRPRNPIKIVDEIIYLRNKYGIKEIHFEDENMSTDLKRLEKFCDELIEKKVDILWQAANGIRPHKLNRRILSKMRESGCTNIILAPESGSQKILDEIINKSMNLDEIVDAFRYSIDANLRTMAYFIMGLPGETKKDLRKTLLFLMKLARIGVDECSIALFVPLPGSKLFYELCDKNRINLNNNFFESLISMSDLGCSKSWSDDIKDKELKKYRMVGYMSFHFTKLLFHPINTFRSVMNILKGKQELKTERMFINKLLNYHSMNGAR